MELELSLSQSKADSPKGRELPITGGVTVLSPDYLWRMECQSFKNTV